MVSQILSIKIEGANHFICAGAIICPGVTVGENCVVGAGAVVTKDVMSNTLVGVIPQSLLNM